MPFYRGCGTTSRLSCSGANKTAPRPGRPGLRPRLGMRAAARPIASFVTVWGPRSSLRSLWM
eukprot:2900189-Pyramimonas_sp.AAC.1